MFGAALQLQPEAVAQNALEPLEVQSVSVSAGHIAAPMSASVNAANW